MQHLEKTPGSRHAKVTTPRGTPFSDTGMDTQLSAPRSASSAQSKKCGPLQGKDRS